MAVDFQRSCIWGYWRFFATQPNVLCKGQFYFTDDATPHLPYFHAFGGDNWREGDQLPVEGLGPYVPPLGQDSNLPQGWVAGTAISDPPRPIPLGSAADFARDETYPVTPAVRLLGGFNSRCVFPCATVPGRITPDLFCFAINDCGYLLAMFQLQYYLSKFNHASFTSAVEMLLGDDAVITFDDGDANFPPFAIVETATNNLIIHSGTNSATQWQTQFRQAYNGPTDVGGYSTLPLWFEGSTRVANTLGAIGADHTKPFVLHGHSMGGAILTNFANRFHLANPNVRIRLTTSGAPKPGDARLMEQIQAIEQLNVIVSDDIVPRLPPSNAMKLALQAVFPLIPDAFFGTWVPHSSYLYLDPGGEFRYDEYQDLDALTFVNIFTGWFVLGLIQGGIHHFSSFYVDAVRAHCPCPELPFTDAWYILNFGTIDCFVAPLLWNGSGEERRVDGNPPLLEFNGQGDGPRRDIPARLLLDGSGINPNKAAELVFNGQGSGPFVNGAANLMLGGGNTAGFSCSTATHVAWGQTVSAKPTGIDNWWTAPLKLGELYRVTFTKTPTLTWLGIVQSGTSCPPTHLIANLGGTFLSTDFFGDAFNPILFIRTTPTTDPNDEYDLAFINLSLEGLSVTGIILPFGGTSAPGGFLSCDGSAVSRTTYADLFAVIGTTWGVGDGSTTFNVPDLRGRSALGAGTGSGLSARTVGQTGGEETHLLTTAETPAHTHDYETGSAPVRIVQPTGGTVGFTGTGTGNAFNRTNTQSTGGGGSHNNMHPFAVCLYIIKT